MKKKAEAKETAAETQETAQEPNVAFAGREWRMDEASGEMRLQRMREAPERVNTQEGTIHLPKSGEQIKAGASGFYSEQAQFLLTHFRAPKKPVAGLFYKAPKPKS